VGVVNRIITELAVMDVAGARAGLRVVEMAPGVDMATLRERTGTSLS
jgi:acyl CoA:acetate/3-ketoacid CoA transferase beta subunit